MGVLEICHIVRCKAALPESNTGGKQHGNHSEKRGIGGNEDHRQLWREGWKNRQRKQNLRRCQD